MSTLPLPARLRLVAADIKLAHSVFALPFALLGAFLARRRDDPWDAFAGKLALVAGCMVAARTWAMLVNRLADRDLDLANPRTARRALPSGRLSVRDARLGAAGAAGAFIALTALFLPLFGNAWPLLLSLPMLAWIAFYSFTKRFTALCHFFLGSALAVSPLAAALAVRPGALAQTPALWWLGAMVLLWVAGFDVIYALQDVEFDRATRLHSLPARLGVRGAIVASRVLHFAAFGALVGAALADARFGPVFYGAVALVGGLLITEHAVLARRGKAGLEMAFFTINGVVSCVLGAAGIVCLLR